MRRALNLVPRARLVPRSGPTGTFARTLAGPVALRLHLGPRLSPTGSARHYSNLPGSDNSPPRLDRGVGEHVVIEASTGPGQSNSWAGHVHLALSGGAEALTLVIRTEPSDGSASAAAAEAVWEDAPEGKDHIKQWHAELVEALLNILVPYLPTTPIRVVGLEAVGKEGEGEGYVKGWVETTVSQWCQMAADDAVSEIREREGDARDVYTLPETAKAIAEAGAPMRNLQFATLAAFDGKVEESGEEGHGHSHEHVHGHSCGPTCNH